MNKVEAFDPLKSPRNRKSANRLSGQRKQVYSINHSFIFGCLASVILEEKKKAVLGIK
jgi:hypothetical protein